MTRVACKTTALTSHSLAHVEPTFFYEISRLQNTNTVPHSSMRISCNTYIDVTVHVTLTCARVFKYDCEDEPVRLSPAHAQSTTDQINFELRVSSAIYKCCARVVLKRPLDKNKAMALTCPECSWPRMLKVAPCTVGRAVSSPNFFGLMCYYYFVQLCCARFARCELRYYFADKFKPPTNYQVRLYATFKCTSTTNARSQYIST